MIAFCITCKGRAGHLSQTLAPNLAHNCDYPDLKFILLLYNEDNKDVLPWLRDTYGPEMESGKLIVYQYFDESGSGPFRMAHAKNIAHRLGILNGADILVNLDADNFTGAGFARYVHDQFQANGPDSFLWSKVIPGKGKQFRGCSGRIAVTACQFILAGGYDEKYATWSPDDKDFNFRLNRLGYTPYEIDECHLRSVPHKDGVRFKEYPHIRELCESGQYSAELEVCESECTIANWGRFGCGRILRGMPRGIEYSAIDIDLCPVPTRIFGVGLHKTATNSLNRALRILGFDSTHWESPRRARTIWTEMKALGRSLTLEKHYALSDLPISILYRELDIAYPGSKFVLTVRPDSEWLDSVRNHWDYTRNQYRKSWDTDCFTHAIHREVYGQKNFDPEIFLARYRQHNAEVQEYFRGRPDDLLVLSMDRDHRSSLWGKLCGFLGVISPVDVEYPCEYITDKI